MWMRLTARGRAGPRLDDPRRQRRHRGRRGGRPAGPSPVPAGADRVRRAVPAPPSPRRPATRSTWTRRTWTGAIAKLGPIARIVGATLRDTANPTMLKAGYKANVIPATAEAVVDCRVLPGRLAAFEREVDELIGPDVTREWITDLPSYETTFDGDLRRRDERRDPGRRSRRPHRARTCCPAAPTQSRSRAWGFAASGSPRCSCRRTWISRRCSTASTNGYPSTR